MKTFNQFINEGIRDKMTPKSEEDILNGTRTLDPYEKINKGIEHNVLSLVKDGVESVHISFDDKTYFLELALLTNIDIEPNEIFLYLKDLWKPGKKLSDKLERIKEKGKELYNIYEKVLKNKDIITEKPFVSEDFDDEYIFEIEHINTTDVVTLGMSKSANNFFLLDDYSPVEYYNTIEEFEEALYNSEILK